MYDSSGNLEDIILNTKEMKKIIREYEAYTERIKKEVQKHSTKV